MVGGAQERRKQRHIKLYLHFSLPAFLMIPLFMKTHHVESTWLGKGLPQEFVLAPYETRLQLTDTSIPLFMAARRGEPRSKGIRRVAFPKAQMEEFGGGWRLYSAQVMKQK